ncbi:P-loop NTPase fold protein [Dickeya dadantii]|uniref:KAP family P-loop NTPase fold protein n=1 Tax=Dickeya dadantii TaxID=204038 RepID=UPI0035A87D52
MTGFSYSSDITTEEDLYGFCAIADSLADSILKLDRKNNVVIGIEGPWGAGKSTLLSLLMKSLEGKKKDKTYVIPVSPWLNGDGNNIVESLLIPVAAIIEDYENSHSPGLRCNFGKAKNRLSSGAKKILDYTQGTSKRIAPIMQFAGRSMSGLPGARLLEMVGNGVEIYGKTDLSRKKKTVSELKKDIEEKINDLEVNFIIVIDDIDRLEPAQAVEVIRMIKSVADFSSFKYILCYDKKILSHAIQCGLGVQDGNIFLQKIIQISFQIPMPESFDFRRVFFDEVCSIYLEVNGKETPQEEVDDILRVVDIYGTTFATPREVKLVCNSLRFFYPNVFDRIYYPDLCFLHIIKLVNPELYNWIEFYLHECYVVHTEEGVINEDDKNDMAASLEKCLKIFRHSSPRDIDVLNEFIPGVEKDHENDLLRVFQYVREEEVRDKIYKKRLSSHIHYKQYFAFSAPRNIIPEDYYTDLGLLSNSPEALAKSLISEISNRDISGQTKFNIILKDLITFQIERYEKPIVISLLEFFFTNSDKVLSLFRKREGHFSMQYTDVNKVVISLFFRLKVLAPNEFYEQCHRLFSCNESVLWTASFMKVCLEQAGLIRNNSSPSNKSIFTKNEIETLREVFSGVIISDTVKNTLMHQELLTGYLYCWRDIVSIESVQDWVKNIVSSDDGFINLLLKLRSVVFSGKEYFILRLSIANEFIQDIDIERRIEKIMNNNQYMNECRIISEAIKESNNF